MKINENELLDLSNIKINKDDDLKTKEILEYEDILFEISKGIINYRKDNKLTQKQLAKILKVDQVMVSKIESGNYNPTFKLLHKISIKLTDSADLFVNILENIIDNIDQMTEISYHINIENKKFVEIDEDNILYLKDYNFNTKQGGYYGTEKCTSQISIAG